MDLDFISVNALKEDTSILEEYADVFDATFRRSSHVHTSDGQVYDRNHPHHLPDL